MIPVIYCLRIPYENPQYNVLYIDNHRGYVWCDNEEAYHANMKSIEDNQLYDINNILFFIKEW